MKVTLAQLRAFVAVSREGSFTRAAEKLDTSQPSITAAVKQLERILELKVFDRSTKTLQLTKASKTFLPGVERILDELDATLTEFRSVSDGSQGTVATAVLPKIYKMIQPLLYVTN